MESFVWYVQKRCPMIDVGASGWNGGQFGFESSRGVCEGAGQYVKAMITIVEHWCAGGMSEMDVSEKLGRAHAIFEGLCREQNRGGKMGIDCDDWQGRKQGTRASWSCPPVRTENGVCWFVGHRPVMSPMSITSRTTSRSKAIPK